jgi:hypothetical protein
LNYSEHDVTLASKNNLRILPGNQYDGSIPDVMTLANAIYHTLYSFSCTLARSELAMTADRGIVWSGLSTAIPMISGSDNMLRLLRVRLVCGLVGP